MSNQQKIDKFWAKLIKAGAEIQHDFEDLDLQDKQVVKERVDAILKMRGIAADVESLIGAMGNFRH